MTTETKELPKSKLTKKQVKHETKEYTEDGDKYRIKAEIRFDDECRNGHNSFAITGDIYRNGRHEGGGCIHDEIIKHLPHLEKYLKWHLCSTDGPMHYLANTLFIAGDKDCNGLKKGEFNSFTYQVISSDEVLFTSRIFYSFRNWLHRDEALKEAQHFLDKIKPSLSPQIVQVGHGEPSEGQTPNLKSARSSAIWPDATLEQLQDKQALEDRLPALMEEFKHDMEELGFTY